MSVPAHDHTLALLRAIEPWVSAFDPSRPGDRESKSREILTILPNATMKDIEATCAENDYTHVHILAHGVQNSKVLGLYGLALHHPLDKSRMDVTAGNSWPLRYVLSARQTTAGGTPGRGVGSRATAEYGFGHQ
jgi:hypothetical protein